MALTGVPERFETYVHALGMWFTVSVYSPRKEHFVAVFDVISERKQAEAALRKAKRGADWRSRPPAAGPTPTTSLPHKATGRRELKKLLGLGLATRCPWTPRWSPWRFIPRIDPRS